MTVELKDGASDYRDMGSEFRHSDVTYRMKVETM